MPIDWRKLLELAPLAVAAAKPGDPRSGALMQGYLQSMQALEAQRRQRAGEDRQRAVQDAQMANLQADNARADEQIGLQRINAFRTAAMNQYGDAVTEPDLTSLAQVYRVPEAATMGVLPPLSTRKKKRAQDIYDRAKQTYGEEALSGDSITIQTGPDLFGDVKPSQLRAMFTEPALTAQGVPAAPYVKSATAGTETERAAQLREKIRGARAAGDADAAAKWQGQYDDLLQAKRELGRADDKPADPAMADLNRQLADLRVQSEKQAVAAGQAKQDEATAATRAKRSTATGLADDTTTVIDELLDTSDPRNPRLKPGAQAIFGLRMPFAGSVPGSQAADAKAALERLTSQLVIGLMSEMKSQSRTGATGFGALSEKELAVLQNAATKLSNQNMSERSAARELLRLRDKIQLIYQQTPAAVATPTGGGGTRTVGRFTVQVEP
jgi:hypothetical protein